MKKLMLAIILLAMLLSACGGGDPTPTVDWPDTDLYLTDPLPAPETPGPEGLLITGAVRYPVDPWDVQEFSGYIDNGEYAFAGAELTVCAGDSCAVVLTNNSGYYTATIVRTWDDGAVNWSVCLEYQGQEFCLRSTFEATTETDDES